MAPVSLSSSLSSSSSSDSFTIENAGLSFTRRFDLSWVDVGEYTYART